MVHMAGTTYEIVELEFMGESSGLWEVRALSADTKYGYTVVTHTESREAAETAVAQFEATLPEGFERTEVGLNQHFNLINWESRVQVWYGSMFAGFYVGTFATVRNSGVSCKAKFDTLDEAIAYARTLIPAQIKRLNRVHAAALKADAAR